MIISKKILFLIFILLSSALYSTIINVPADQPTIQVGIDASTIADTVLVQPGTYVENINFNGKLITLGSLFLTTQDSSYILSTIIDGNAASRVVSFVSSENSSAILNGFTITNGSSSYGAGIYCNGASPTLVNLLIKENTAISGGGGVSCYHASPTFKNVTLINNHTDSQGGGIYCYGNSNSLIENVTISNNTATVGGGIWSHTSEPNIINSILWNNSPWEIDLNSSAITVSYSDIEGGEAGIAINNNCTVNWLDGNIDEDPLFVDAGNGDYNLTEGSPCIDAGDPSSPLDPDGTTADMGAWFYDQSSAIEENEIQNVNYNLSNYPNPFNPLTTIKFDIKENEIGTLKIFNMKGQLLESYQFDAGEHNFQWDASNMSSGVYLYQLQTENTTVNKKMLLLK